MSNKYTLRDLKITRIVAIILTILSFGVCSIVVLLQNFKVSEEVDIITCLLYYLLPILVILSWLMCMERYVYLEVKTGTIQDSKRIRKRCNSNVALITICGLCLFGSALTIVYFVSNFGKYLGELWGYFIIISFVTVFWFIYLNTSIRRIKKIDAESEFEKRKIVIHRIVLCVLVLASILCIFHAIREADSFVFLKRVLGE